MRTMAAARFKAQCLAVMDEVHAKRQPVLVTKNGRPVAKLVPLDIPEGTDPLDAFYFGKIEILGDIVAPPYSDEDLDKLSEASLKVFK